LVTGLFTFPFSSWAASEEVEGPSMEFLEDVYTIGDMDVRISTYTIPVPLGYGVEIVLTPGQVEMQGVPGIPLGKDNGLDTLGCLAVPGQSPDGWAVSPFGECEPDVEHREWQHEPIKRLVFSTNGEGTGAVNAVNFPDPWDPARHGVFLLWCNITGAGAMDTEFLFQYTQATCGLIEFGIPLWEYDEWTSHVAAKGSFPTSPTQLYSLAVWEKDA
jgi:hypothetical protein